MSDRLYGAATAGPGLVDSICAGSNGVNRAADEDLGMACMLGWRRYSGRWRPGRFGCWIQEQHGGVSVVAVVGL